MPDVVCSFRSGIAVRGKQAKILSDGSLEDLLLFADEPHPLRNKVLPIEIDAETPAKVWQVSAATRGVTGLESDANLPVRMRQTCMRPIRWESRLADAKC